MLNHIMKGKHVGKGGMMGRFFFTFKEGEEIGNLKKPDTKGLIQSWFCSSTGYSHAHKPGTKAHIPPFLC